MSWSFSAVGRPAKVVDALNEHSKRLSDYSLQEFNDAKTHLIGLCQQCFAEEESGYPEPLIKLAASGSGLSRGGEAVQRQLQVNLEFFYNPLL